jgi:hypothetical protein
MKRFTKAIPAMPAVISMALLPASGTWGAGPGLAWRLATTMTKATVSRLRDKVFDFIIVLILLSVSRFFICTVDWFLDKTDLEFISI